MSERNGDKARFQRERQRKILRRKRTRELQKTLAPAGLAAALSIRDQISTPVGLASNGGCQ